MAVTTTTHMAIEKERPFALNGEGAEALIFKHGYVLAASIDIQKKKLSSLPCEKLKKLSELCDVLLIEADGARKSLLKFRWNGSRLFLILQILSLQFAGWTLLENP